MLSSAFVAAAIAALATIDGVSAFATPKMRRDASTGRTTPLLKTFAGQAALPALATLTNANSTGTVLDLTNIQGDILIGMKKPVENFYFFSITNATAFKEVMRSDVLPLVTSTATLLGPVNQQPLAFVNVAFSQTGLTALGVTDNMGDSLYSAGQFADAAALGDQTSTWESAFAGTSIHGVFLVGSDDTAHVQSTINPVTAALQGAANIVLEVDGAARPGDQAGHEHFGYLDGISNPGVAGFTNVTTLQLPGQSIVPTGVILAGRSGDSVTRPAWALDGSFLAFRKLQQLVPEFNKFLLDNSVSNASSVQEGAEIFGSRLVGRFKSGAPIDIVGEVDDPTLGADPQRNNNFDYSNAADGEKCPFSAHVRKTRPRDDLNNANVNNQAIRAGIPYGPEVSDSEASSNTTSTDRGLAFVMYQSNLANGFHFLQKTWANNANFIFGKTTPPGLDPIIGQNGGAVRSFTGSNPNNITESISEGQTVISNGGEYFFSPSISALNNTILALD